MIGLGRLNAFSLTAVCRRLLPPRFVEPATEAAFWAEYAQRLAPQRRAGIALTLLVWAIYVGLDIDSTHESGPIHPEVLALRAIGVAGLLIGLACSFHSRFKTARFADRLICTFGTGLYAFLLTMVMFVDFPYSYVYDFTGLLFFILGFVGLFRLSVRTLLGILPLWFLVSVPALAFAALGPSSSGHSIGDWRGLVTAITSYVFIAAISYLFSFMLVGAAITALLEREARAAFVRERQMADANAALVESRRDLETKSLALVAAKEDLRALAEQQNQNKSKFLADAAHDLSQPVHAVSLLIESAKYALERQDTRKSAALMDAAGRAARLTRSSFKAVLEISQLESGLIRPTYSVFDVEELIAEVAAPLRVIAEAQGVTVRLRCSRKVSPIVRSDRALLGRAIANLLSNAIKYADPAKGDRRTVLVGAVSLSHRVRIDVVDNGIGIPSERRADVFQPFVQIGNPERNREKGLGLGLSIVAATADLLTRHKIIMRSVEGRGTRISLETPRHAGWRELVAYAQGAAIGSGDLASLFIWCVEDDEMNREATLALLDELGVLTDQAGSLEQLEHALERTERAPDLIVSDYRLPEGRTADDVVVAFSRRWSEPIPVLVLTGDVAVSAALTTRERTLFLKKPASPEAIIAAIHQLCFSPGHRPEPAATVPAATPPRSS